MSSILPKCDVEAFMSSVKHNESDLSKLRIKGLNRTH